MVRLRFFCSCSLVSLRHTTTSQARVAYLVCLHRRRIPDSPRRRWRRRSTTKRGSHRCVPQCASLSISSCLQSCLFPFTFASTPLHLHKHAIPKASTTHSERCSHPRIVPLRSLSNSIHLVASLQLQRASSERPAQQCHHPAETPQGRAHRASCRPMLIRSAQQMQCRNRRICHR